MAKFEKFCTRFAYAKEARELVREWRLASPATRKAACKRMGDGFIVKVRDNRSGKCGVVTKFYVVGALRFSESGKVEYKEIELPKNKWDEPSWAKTQKTYEVDATRKVVGFAYGRPIYGK